MEFLNRSFAIVTLRIAKAAVCRRPGALVSLFTMVDESPNEKKWPPAHAVRRGMADGQGLRALAIRCSPFDAY